MKFSLALTGPAFVFALSASAAGDPVSRAEFQANPFQGVCRDTILLADKSFQTDREFWEPVVRECSQSIQKLPDTGFFATVASRLGEENDQVAAAGFLEKVGQRTLDNIDYNNKLSELWAHCARAADDPKGQADWFAKRRAAADTLARTDKDMAAFDHDLYDPTKCADRLAQLRTLVARDGEALRVAREIMKETAGAGSRIAELLRKGADAAVEAVDWSLPLGLEKLTLPGESVAPSRAEVAQAQEAVKAADAAARERLRRIGEEGVKKLIRFRKDAPNAPLEAIDDPSVPSWVVRWYKAGGGRGLKETPDGAADVFDIQVADDLSKELFSRAFEDYSRALGETRILAYLGNRSPSSAELAKAADQLLANGLKARADTESLLKKPPRSTSNVRVNQLLSLLKNGPVVREVLSQSPALCGTAAGLVNFASNKDTRDGALITAGLVVGGIGAAVLGPIALGAAGLTVSGAAISTTVGMATSAGTLYVDYQRFQAAKAHTFNLAHADSDTWGAGKPNTETDEFWDARNAFVIDAAIISASVAVPAAYRALLPKDQAALQAEVVLRRLMSPAGGSLSEAEAKQLIRNLASADTSVARSAAAALAKALGVDDDELSLFRTVVRKQLLDPGSRDELFEYSKRLASLKGPQGSEQRKILLGRMQQVLDAVDGAKVGQAKRSDAMRLVLAASEFGLYDSAEVTFRATEAVRLQGVAKVVNSWDNGLYGLARVYEQARANLLTAEIQALPEASRSKAAFSEALRQLGVADPAVNASMLTCAFEE